MPSAPMTAQVQRITPFQQGCFPCCGKRLPHQMQAVRHVVQAHSEREGRGVAPMPAGRLLHASHDDQTPTGFTAVGDAAGVRQPHLVKIVPLRVRRFKTFGTITPRQVRRGDGQMAVATAEPGVCLAHEHQVAMRAGAHRMGPPQSALTRLDSGPGASRTGQQLHGVRPFALLGQYHTAGPYGRVIALPHASRKVSQGVEGRR